MLNHTLKTSSVDTPVGSLEARKDSQEGSARDVIKFFPTRPRVKDPCKVTYKIPADKHLTFISYGECLRQ